MRSSHLIRVVAFLALVSPAVVSAQVPSDLRTAMRSRDSSVARANAATWDRLTTPDFTVVNENGLLLTKASRLAQIKAATPSAFNTPQREEIMNSGQLFVRRYLGDSVWVMEVWKKGSKGWRVRAVQVTAVKP
jgi:hypothetical protein